VRERDRERERERERIITKQKTPQLFNKKRAEEEERI
jgi:hypothetical protein